MTDQRYCDHCGKATEQDSSRFDIRETPSSTALMNDRIWCSSFDLCKLCRRELKQVMKFFFEKGKVSIYEYND